MAKNRVGKYPLSFRKMAMERMKDCPSVSALADELGIHRTVLYHWQRQLRAAAGDSGVRAATSPVRELRQQVRELKRALAEKTLEVDFQRCLAKGRGSAPEQQELWRNGIYDQIRELMPMQGSLSIELARLWVSVVAGCSARLSSLNFDYSLAIPGGFDPRYSAETASLPCAGKPTNPLVLDQGIGQYKPLNLF